MNDEHILKEYCEEMGSSCRECPFLESNGDCRIALGDSPCPAEWEVEENAAD